MLFCKNSVLSITLLHTINTYVIAYSLSFILEHIYELCNNRQEHALPVYFRPVFVASNMQATYFSNFGYLFKTISFASNLRLLQ